MSEPFLGEIKAFGFNFAPRGFAFCNGQLLAISQYSALFSLLGTTYGGDGRTTFALPDLQGRVPMHFGHGGGLSYRPLGQKAGSEITTLIAANLPPASPISAATTITGDVTVGVCDALGDSAFAPNNGLAKLARDVETNAGIEAYVDTPTFEQGNTLAGVTHNLSAVTQVTGGLSGGNSTPLNNMQPYLVLNYCIALVGIFPSRN